MSSILIASAELSTVMRSAILSEVINLTGMQYLSKPMWRSFNVTSRLPPMPYFFLGGFSLLEIIHVTKEVHFSVTCHNTKSEFEIYDF